MGENMFQSTEIGIDLGTANILVYSKNKGIILNEPSVVAVDTTTKAVLAIGADAKNMIGKTPGKIIAVRPMKDGVIADYDMTTDLLKHIMKKAAKSIGMSFRKPNVVVCTPSGSTAVERRAISDAVKNCGAKNVHLIEEPVAAAIGADLPVDEPVANVVVDIGGGTTEVAIISFGGVVSCHSIRIGGDQLDEDIVSFVRKKYNLLIGERTAEQVKMEIGHALILEAIRATLEDCPPELSGDIVDRGVILTGGGALLNGIKEWLTEEIVVPVHVAQNPLESVAIGTGRSLEVIDKLQKAIK